MFCLHSYPKTEIFLRKKSYHYLCWSKISVWFWNEKAATEVNSASKFCAALAWDSLRGGGIPRCRPSMFQKFCRLLRHRLCWLVWEFCLAGFIVVSQSSLRFIAQTFVSLDGVIFFSFHCFFFFAVVVSVMNIFENFIKRQLGDIQITLPLSKGV